MPFIEVISAIVYFSDLPLHMFKYIGAVIEENFANSRLKSEIIVGQIFFSKQNMYQYVDLKVINC